MKIYKQAVKCGGCGNKTFQTLKKVYTYGEFKDEIVCCKCDEGYKVNIEMSGK